MTEAQHVNESLYGQSAVRCPSRSCRFRCSDTLTIHKKLLTGVVLLVVFSAPDGLPIDADCDTILTGQIHNTGDRTPPHPGLVYSRSQPGTSGKKKHSHQTSREQRAGLKGNGNSELLTELGKKMPAQHNSIDQQTDILEKLLLESAASEAAPAPHPR